LKLERLVFFLPQKNLSGKLIKQSMCQVKLTVMS